MATTWQFNGATLIIPRGDYEDATEIIGVDHVSLDGTLTPDVYGSKWGVKITVTNTTAMKDAILSLYTTRSTFTVRDENNVTRTCLIPIGGYGARRIHRGPNPPKWEVSVTLRQQ